MRKVVGEHLVEVRLSMPVVRLLTVSFSLLKVFETFWVKKMWVLAGAMPPAGGITPVRSSAVLDI